MGRLEGPNREVREDFQPQSTKIKWRRAPRKVKLVLSDLEVEIKTLKSYIGIELQVLAVVGPLKLMCVRVRSQSTHKLENMLLRYCIGNRSTAKPVFDWIQDNFRGSWALSGSPIYQ
jgi:hypothetical protein